MSRRYDAKTTTFTQEGRLMQVEYAIEAINKTGPAIGILTTEGIVLATEKQVVSSLLEQSKQSEKIYCLDKHMYCIVSGLTADANYLIDYARLQSQRYKYALRENMPMEQLIQDICDLKQSYTQIGGMRPFGTAFVFAGWDKNYKFQLYTSDPSGNYSGWKATAIGTNNLAANSFLREEYDEKIGLEKGMDLAIKALSKTLDTSTPSPEKIEIVTITLKDKDEVKAHTLNDEEIKVLMKKNNLVEEKKAQ
jgi:20S proteasome subunit alpha 3